MRSVTRLALAASAALPSLALHAACGTASCTVNTNWETQGPALGPGLSVDLRFEYIDQDQLRKGSHKTRHAQPEGDGHHEAEEHAHTESAIQQPARPLHDGEDHAEHDERSTRNRNLRARFDYSFNATWGVSVDVPLVSRKHAHVNLDSAETEHWDFNALGDVRISARYARMFDANSSWGLTFGAKLPTGKFEEENDHGEHAERSLQPGTGTTDLLLGAFYQRSREAWSYFGQLALQQALNSRDEYKPGRQILADIGVGYRFNAMVTGMLQLNLQHREHDSGDNAEPDDSGGQFAFVSPGVQLRLSENTQAYAFVQLPLYQYVNGTQLTADKALLVGINHRF